MLLICFHILLLVNQFSFSAALRCFAFLPPCILFQPKWTPLRRAPWSHQIVLKAWGVGTAEKIQGQKSRGWKLKKALQKFLINISFCCWLITDVEKQRERQEVLTLNKRTQSHMHASQLCVSTVFMGNISTLEDWCMIHYLGQWHLPALLLRSSLQFSLIPVSPK